MARILVIDDSPSQLAGIRRIVEKLGHECLTAEDGASGVELARQVLPDLVLMDVVMPNLNGFQATRAITRDASSAKARDLARLGAEVVGANVDDVESLKQAFAGAYGAFCVTFFWEHFSAEKEIAALRATREGVTQSKVSAPASTAAKKSSGSEIPRR